MSDDMPHYITGKDAYRHELTDMEQPRLKIGILGAGHIAGVHARHAARVPGVVLSGVTDLQTEKAEALAQQYGATVYPDVNSLLASDIDAVVVAVPTNAHIEMTESVLRAGKSAFCEKPLALSVADCEALMKTLQLSSESSQRPLILAVGHVIRFFPEYAQARQQVQSGAIGEVAVARTRRAGDYPKAPWFADESKSGGVLFDLLIHDLDFLLWTLGPVERVYAKIGRSEGVEYASVVLRHRSGAISQSDGLWGDPAGFSTSFEFAGDAGLITFDSRTASTVTIATQSKASLALAPREPDSDPYYHQFASFADAVHGLPSQSVTVTEARDVVAIAEAARQSALTGKPMLM